jgi:serine/threonine protein kinase
MLAPFVEHYRQTIPPRRLRFLSVRFDADTQAARYVMRFPYVGMRDLFCGLPDNPRINNVAPSGKPVDRAHHVGPMQNIEMVGPSKRAEPKEVWWSNRGSSEYENPSDPPAPDVPIQAEPRTEQFAVAFDKEERHKFGVTNKQADIRGRVVFYDAKLSDPAAVGVAPAAPSPGPGFIGRIPRSRAGLHPRQASESSPSRPISRRECRTPAPLIRLRSAMHHPSSPESVPQDPGQGEPAGGAETLPAGPGAAPTSGEAPTMALPPAPPSVPATPTEAAREPPHLPGYEILGELGRGGMGVVYQARQLKLDRVVALKMIIAGGHAGAAELARFRNEAEAIARLQHPNIVQIHDVGDYGGLPFFSLEYCPGGSLDRQLNGTPMSAARAAALVETLARAVQAAHQKGVIHRDLKPANVLLADDGSPKITDYGLARKLDQAGQTQPGTVLGTPGYMAPEQAGGKGQQELGPACDIYALGAILYECLTGRPPFKAATPLDTVLQVLSDEPVPPSQLQPTSPRDLETICLKCLQKEPAKRYGSAEDLADDLRRFRAGEPILARPVSRLERLWRWGRRNPGLAGLSAVAAALLLAVGVLLAAMIASSPSTPPDASLQRVKTSGRLVIATDPSYPPMEFQEDGQLMGFDIDFARQLAHRLGVEAEFRPVAWDWQDLTAQLNSHEFDLLISSVTVTDARMRQVDFVEYRRLPLVLICKQDVAVRDEKDLAGKVVAVQADTTAHKLAVDLKRNGIPIKQISVFPSSTEPFEAVQKDAADVTFAHEPVADYFAKKDHRLAVKHFATQVPDRVGIALCKRDKQLQSAVAHALSAIKGDGVFDNLVEHWLAR